MGQGVKTNRNVYQASYFLKPDGLGGYKTVHLQELSWIFNCPDCEYVMTALTEEGIKTIELRHMTIMPSIHIDSLKELGWSESPLSQITEMKPARQRKAPTTRTRKKTA